MAYQTLDEQSAPANPSSGKQVIYPDSASSMLHYKTDANRGFGEVYNQSSAAQALAASDTYVTGSDLLIPSFGLQVGSRIVWRISLSKTGAGTAAPVWTVRLGTAGTTADASQWAHTGVAQTAVAETGFYELVTTVRSIGASGVLQGTLTCARTGGTAATGLASVPAAELSGAAASKDWASGQKIGLSINAGASSAWTVTQVHATLEP